MEAFSSQLKYKSNTHEYYKKIFPWLTEIQIKKKFKLEEITENNTHGILISYKNEYYFLTPLLDLQPFDLKYISPTSDIECDILFHSAQYKLTLSKLRSKPIEDAIKLEDFKKNIPNENEKITIDNIDYHFKKEFLNVLGLSHSCNLYYFVEKADLKDGLAVYYNKNLTGIVINNNKILNVLSIINFINEALKTEKYSGLFGIFYDYIIKDDMTIIKNNNNIIYSNIKKNNIYKGDILLEVDNYKILENTIQHNLLGKIDISTYLLLFHNYDTNVKLKIIRNNLEEIINIKPQGLYDYEIISTDLNKFTKYKIKNKIVYYYLNNHIIYELTRNDKFAIENILQVLLNKCNINNNEFFIMKYNKNKKIELKDKIDFLNNKMILSLDDL
jgi:hypothetical protein